MKVTVIGAGIMGISIARELALRGVERVTVIEKEPLPGQHASGRNSGVIHSGINQKPGSQKARFCVDGSRRLREFCVQNRVPMNVCGTLVVATQPEETAVIDELFDWGNACGVEGLKKLSEREVKAREPLVTRSSGGLFSPLGAVVDSPALLAALENDAKRLGVQFEYQRLFDPEVLRERHPETDYWVNCAGLYTDHVAQAFGAGKGYRVVPFRGEYMEVHGLPVQGMIYRVPDLRFPFLSIHLTRETDGRVLAGPSAVLSLGRESYEKQIHWRESAGMIFSRQFMRMGMSFSFWRLAAENARTSLSAKAFLKEIRRLVPDITEKMLSPARSGIRAQMVDSQGNFVTDIHVEYTKQSCHVLNAVSPGMTCALSFASFLADEVISRKDEARG